MAKRKCCNTEKGAGPHEPDCIHAVQKVGVNARLLTQTESQPDWNRKCLVCGASPVVPVTGLCGPCTFGEAETVGGNW